MKTEIQDFITQTLSETSRHRGSSPSAIDGDENLITSRHLDSLGFVSLMSAIELKFDVELEFDGGDPEKFMTVNGLVASTIKAIEEGA